MANEWDHTAPTGDQARGMLHAITRDGAGLAERVKTPWWYHLTLAIVTTLLVSSQAMAANIAIFMVVLGIAAISVVVMTYQRRYGVITSQPAGPASKRIFIGLLVATFVLFAAALLIKILALPAWLVLVPAALSFAITLVGGHAYDNALRSDLRRRAELTS